MTYSTLSTEAQESETGQVLKTVQAWNDVFEINLPDRYFEFIHDDLTLFFPSSPYRIESKASDELEFRWSLSEGRTKIHFFQELQPLVQIWNNTAVVTYHSRMAVGKDGEEQIVYLKETNVLVKVDNNWRIVHIHVSL